MGGGFAAMRSGERFEKDFLTEGAHFVDEFLQSAVLADGEAKGLSLFLGKSDRDRLCFDLASPTPCAWMTLRDAALAD